MIYKILGIVLLMLGLSLLILSLLSLITLNLITAILFFIFGIFCIFQSIKILKNSKGLWKNYKETQERKNAPFKEESNKIVQLKEVKRVLPKNTASLEKIFKVKDSLVEITQIQKYNQMHKNWNILVSFGKSNSQNFSKAIYLAKESSAFKEEEIDGSTVYTVSYGASKEEFISFINLYEIVSQWKSTTFFVNGKIVDKKTIGKIKYCYGDKCRSIKFDYCYGASELTENPFGCHRLQISTFNNPWWEYYKEDENGYVFKKEEILDRINKANDTFNYCPNFDIEEITRIVNLIPMKISDAQYEKLMERARERFVICEYSN